MKLSISKIEALIQTLVEGSALNLFASKNPVKDLGDQLILALKKGVHTETDGTNIAPDFYTIIAHPTYLNMLQAQNNWREISLGKLHLEAKKRNYSFITSPTILCETDGTISPQKVEIVAQISIDKITSTTDLGIDFIEDENCFPPHAFFIVNGSQTYPLSHSVINIGRRPDNDLVIEDSRVSRVHAQLRAVKGNFIIFDLDSTGGTSVNGQKITQWVLSPGDVISLAGVPLVYGQETNIMGETDQIMFDSPVVS